MTTRKPSKHEAKPAATGAASEIARVSSVARRYLIEMAATASVSASVLLCLFVVRHYT